MGACLFFERFYPCDCLNRIVTNVTIKSPLLTPCLFRTDMKIDTKLQPFCFCVCSNIIRCDSMPVPNRHE